MQVQNDIAQKTAELLLSIEAVSFRFDPPYTYTSGLKSPIYLDNRLILSYPEVRSQIIDLYVDLISQKIGTENVEWISGTATAAIPQASWISQKMNLPMVYCRSSAKEHGKGKQIEGFIKPNSKVLIVEDHISTGGSSINNAEAVRAEGGIVEYCIATTTYETQKAEDEFSAHELTLLALTTGKIIVEQAVQSKVLSDEQALIVMDWFSDPEGWLS